MRESLDDFSRQRNRLSLLLEWHPTKNGSVSPKDVSYGSKKKVWWRCDKGHEWQATVYSRTGGNTRCPYCIGKNCIPGENDLASQYPELAEQWHPTKNHELRPNQVMTKTNRKVWWLCAHGHEWQADISSRTAGKGCPACAGTIVVTGVNDLASRYPDIAEQWHPEKNGKETPQSVSIGSHYIAWWLCEKGHEYPAKVGNRVYNKTECPYCTGRKVLPGFNDLATLEPEVADQWHPTLNKSLKPEMVTTGSGKRVWWQCPEGHVWKVAVCYRTGKKTNCPVCAGTVKIDREKLIK